MIRLKILNLYRYYNNKLYFQSQHALKKIFYQKFYLLHYFPTVLSQQGQCLYLVCNVLQIHLKVNRIDNDPKIADIIYRIQTVCRLLFESTSVFKIFAMQDKKIFRQAISAGGKNVKIPVIKQEPAVVKIHQKLLDHKTLKSLLQKDCWVQNVICEIQLLLIFVQQLTGRI